MTNTIDPAEADLRQRILGLMEDRSVALLLETSLDYCEQFPESAWGWLVSVPTLVDLGLYRAAEKAWRRARKYSDDDAESMLCYWGCVIKKEQGKLKRAQRFIERAIELEPDQGSYWVTLGDVLAKRGKLNAAKKAHRAAITANTSDVDEAHYNLALLLRAQRRYGESLDEVAKALAIDPDYAEAHALRQDLQAVTP